MKGSVLVQIQKCNVRKTCCLHVAAASGGTTINSTKKRTTRSFHWLRNCPLQTHVVVVGQAQTVAVNDRMKTYSFSTDTNSLSSTSSSSTINIDDKDHDQDQSNGSVQQLNQDWIPPNRPLIGDIGMSSYANVRQNAEVEQQDQNETNYNIEMDVVDDYDEDEELRQLELEIQRLEEEEAAERKKLESSASTKWDQVYQQQEPDWLKLRRSIFGTDNNLILDTNGTHTNDTTTINSNINGTSKTDIIPCKLYTLLSKDEIMKCLTTYGGQEIVLLLDDFENRRMGGAIGIIVVSANNVMQMRQLGDVLVRQLRKRKLQERGVVGAELGIEGDTKSTTYDDPYSQQRWFVVDCANYIVHIQDERTRKAINLEGLWSGTDPMFQIRNLRDDDEVETYIANHPIPDDYIVDSGYVSRTSKSSLVQGRSTSFTDTIHRLQKSRWTVNRNNNDSSYYSHNSSLSARDVKRQKRKQERKEKQQMKR